MRASAILAAVSATSVAAISQGFNYGSTLTTGAAKQVSDFTAEFNAAKALAGTNGAFTSARLYTCVQAGTSANYISAFQAAIDTDTTLLLGLWGSGGQTAFSNELAALSSAITGLGSAFTSRVVGISVGSEDLYRISPTGIAAMSGYGAGPDVLVSYISQLRSAIAGTALAKVPVGHVDTWTAWVNGSNSAVISAVDFLGTDAYPYFQTTQANSIANGPGLFNDAYQATVAVANSKPVWITETGWPVSGSTAGEAVPSPANAKTYWDAVGCPNFGVVNTYWYTLDDALPDTPNPSFGVIATLTSSPIFDLSCAAVASSSVAPSSTATVASSAVSSVANLATSSALATSGGGLSPSQGAGNGVANSQLSALTKSASTTSAVAPASSASSAAGVATTSKAGTTSVVSVAATSTLSTSKTATGTATAATSTYTGAATNVVGNFFGGVAAAVIAALAVL